MRQSEIIKELAKYVATVTKREHDIVQINVALANWFVDNNAQIKTKEQDDWK